jgi:hypothetical protein
MASPVTPAAPVTRQIFPSNDTAATSRMFDMECFFLFIDHGNYIPAQDEFFSKSGAERIGRKDERTGEMSAAGYDTLRESIIVAPHRPLTGLYKSLVRH